MNVFITTTPEISQQLSEDVRNILSFEKGEFKFNSIESMNYKTLSLIDDNLASYDSLKDFQFNVFFKICELLRTLNKTIISDDDFVIVLTSIKNTEEWFSCFDGKNIFINTNNWEDLTFKDKKYGISFQIVENIFQSLINLDIKDFKNEPNIHHVPIGCINDMCENENEVIFKLRTGFICDSCFDRALSSGISEKLFVDIYQIVQKLRDKFINFDRINEFLRPYYIDVHSKYIKIGDKKLKLGALNEAVFRFFLNHSDGVKSLYEKEDYKEELLTIYLSLKKEIDFERFNKTINLLCNFDYDVSTFYKVKSSLKKKLMEQIGESYYKYYIIDEVIIDNESKYLVNIPQSYIRFL